MLKFDLKRRWLCFIAGIILSGFAVALSTQAGLGATPISSVPYVLSFIIPLTFGTWTLLLNILFVFVQVAILRRDFPKHQYLQIAATVLFGLIIDLGMFLTKPFCTDFYPAQLLMLIGGSAILAAGIAMQVMSEILYLPGDGIVKVIAAKLKWNFGILKVSFDVTLTVSAVLLSLLFLTTLQGIREGTVIGAFSVGTMVSLFLVPLRSVKKFCYVRSGKSV